ncbi:MAG: hypothetical protein PWQ98_746 [Moorella sp. (in: firmicutes)]|nr:hypothetical protein [Moorella sp. (in: firmicutes)]
MKPGNRPVRTQVRCQFLQDFSWQMRVEKSSSSAKGFYFVMRGV